MSSDEINPTMISVINLESSVTNLELFDYFKTAGEVIWCEVRKHKSSGQSLGYGYVSYSNPQHGMYVRDVSILFHNFVLFFSLIRYLLHFNFCYSFM